VEAADLHTGHNYMASEREEFRVSGGTLWDGRTLHDLYAEAFMAWSGSRLRNWRAIWEWIVSHSALFDGGGNFLEEMNVPAHKFASLELVDILSSRKWPAPATADHVNGDGDGGRN